MCHVDAKSGRAVARGIFNLTFFFLFFFFFLSFFFPNESFFMYLFIYSFFLAVLGLRFCARAFSSCGEQGPLFIAVRGPLTIAASLVAEHRLQTRRLSSCGSWAQLLRGMWDFPRPGLEPVSPALAGRFSTTAPPGKPHYFFLFKAVLTHCKRSGTQRQAKRRKYKSQRISALRDNHLEMCSKFVYSSDFFFLS